MDLISCSNHNNDKKYVIDCVTSTFFRKKLLEKKKEKWRSRRRKRKKKVRTRGASNLRRKLLYLSIIHNINNTYLVSLIHTSTSHLNNIFFGIRVFTYIFPYICRYILAQSASSGLQFFGPFQHFSGPSPLSATAYNWSKR